MKEQGVSFLFVHNYEPEMQNIPKYMIDRRHQWMVYMTDEQH